MTHLGANAALEDTAGPARNRGLRDDGAGVPWSDFVGHGSLVGRCPGVRVVDLQGALEDVLREGVVETAADSESIGDAVTLGDGNGSTRSNTVDLGEKDVSLPFYPIAQPGWWDLRQGTSAHPSPRSSQSCP